VLDKAYDLKNQLGEVARVDIDASEKMPGWKFSECEMKGYPIRVEIGPKDIEKNQAVIVRRDTGEKEFVSLDDIETRVTEELEKIQTKLLKKTVKNPRKKNTNRDYKEKIKTAIRGNPGFKKAMGWGDQACEEKVKKKNPVHSRCIPFEQEE